MPTPPAHGFVRLNGGPHLVLRESGADHSVGEVVDVREQLTGDRRYLIDRDRRVDHFGTGPEERFGRRRVSNPDALQHLFERYSPVNKLADFLLDRLVGRRGTGRPFHQGE